MSSALELNSAFGAALRGELVDFVRLPPRRSRRWKLTAATFTGVLILSGVGVATAAILGLPGAPVVVALSEEMTFTGTGPADTQLGAVPDNTTDLAVEFKCTTPGAFTIADIAITCDGSDIQSATTFDLPIAAVPGGRLTVQVNPPDGGWELRAAYVNKNTSPWATNENGDTYGAINDLGAPDLVAVEATNGKNGYAYATDIAYADGDPNAHGFDSPADALEWQKEMRGTTVTIPVFESDGTTQIGGFDITR
ncbi:MULTISPECIES: hypothetical protein [Microbacterium]|uniref:DUF4352 domain-containing protein n=1 Tax=Microbacterium marmarense TaxID=3122051 RepID=A0ABU8LV07_9MICO